MDIPDIYLMLTSMQDDRSVVNMLSVNKKFNDPNFFHQLFSKRYPNLIKYKKEDQDWKQFYLEMVKYIYKLKEDFKYEQKYEIFSTDNPKELYYQVIGSLSTDPRLRERIQYVESDTSGKILDISDIDSQGKNIRFIHAPGERSKKKPIQGLKIYSDKLKKVIILAKLIGDYSIIERWTGI